ncbi:MAG: sulfatase/phosphatase domain-containing protein [Solirubrobacterales bacterium]
MVGNVDLAPTILDLADAKPDLAVDGRSMLPFEREIDDRRGEVLLEVYERNHGRFVGLRTRRYLYAEYDGRDTELYDLKRDPEQLERSTRTRATRTARAPRGATLAATPVCGVRTAASAVSA